MEDLLKNDLKTALKAGDALRVLVLRMLLSEMNYKKIDLQRELTDEDILGVMAKEVKKRREAADSFTAGGRGEQAETERKEMEILAKYLPKMMSEMEIEKEIEKLPLPSDFGQAMKIVAPIFKGRADGTLVAKIVKKLCL